MNDKVFCTKHQEALPALDYAPYPGTLGKRIQSEISAKAWEEWLNHQTMLINEYRFNLSDPKSRAFLEKEMVKFLFEGGSEKPEGYTPEE